MTIQKLLATNLHLGYRTPYSDFHRYLYGFRNEMAIIDAEKTFISIRRTCHLIGQIVQLRGSGRLLFVNTNPAYNAIVAQMAMKTSQSYINSKWIGGLLTNWKLTRNLPDCIVTITPNLLAIQEAKQLQIPIISLVDSYLPNAIHKIITYPIPVNVDSIHFVYLYCNLLTKTLCLRRGSSLDVNLTANPLFF